MVWLGTCLLLLTTFPPFCLSIPLKNVLPFVTSLLYTILHETSHYSVFPSCLRETLKQSCYLQVTCCQDSCNMCKWLLSLSQLQNLSHSSLSSSIHSWTPCWFFFGAEIWKLPSDRNYAFQGLFRFPVSCQSCATHCLAGGISASWSLLGSLFSVYKEHVPASSQIFHSSLN